MKSWNFLKNAIYWSVNHIKTEEEEDKIVNLFSLNIIQKMAIRVLLLTRVLKVKNQGKRPLDHTFPTYIFHILNLYTRLWIKVSKESLNNLCLISDLLILG